MTSNSGKHWVGLGALAAAVIAGVFALEGGYSNNPNDAGGETNHGITERVAREHGFTGDMRTLTKAQAEAIYTTTYIDAPNFRIILAASPAVGTKLIDIGVNAGPARAATWFQMALNDLSRGGRDYNTIQADGAVGPMTVAAFKRLQAVRGNVKSCELVIKLLDAHQATHYSRLAQSFSNASFMVGWVDNRVGNVHLDRCKETV